MPLTAESSIDTTTPFFTKAAGSQPIPGYRLIEPLGRGGFGEVWKCEAPGGLPKAIKFVPGDGSSALSARNAAQQELRALEHCKAIRHPFILSMERVELIDGELIIVMELADRSLHDVARECSAVGRPGIPRAELLAYLREAAEVLDFLYHEHRLQHLDIKPQNLFLISTHVKVADFGLVNSLAERRAHAEAPCGTPLYSAPEVFNGRISQHSDQYSLAITYQELLTGTWPLQGRNFRQLMMLHATAEPDLDALPARDRAFVAKALAKDPNHRFPSCLEFIHSLMYEKIVLSSVTAAPLGLEDPAATPQGFLDETLPDHEAARALAPAAAVASCDVMPGYELQKCLGRSMLSDLWLVHGPDGRDRHAQLLHAPPYRGAVVVDKLNALRHPALPVQEILRSPSGRIFAVGDPQEPTLADRFATCRSAGQPGIPRTELLGYLTSAAAALDELQLEHRFPHLMLQPRSIVLRSERVLVAQFGMAALLWPLQVKAAAALNARYAAPELYDPGFSPTSDQYSLALIYAEMLMGVQPRAGRWGGARGQGKLDLDLLPACDRAVLARALHADPAQRFASCGEFLQALSNAARTVAARDADQRLAEVVQLMGVGSAAAPIPNAEQVATVWLLSASKAKELRQHGNLRYLVYDNPVIEHRYPVRIIPGALRFKLHDLPKHLQAAVSRQDGDALVCRIPAPRTFWQRCFSDESGLILQVSVQPTDDPNPQLVEALVRIEPYGKLGQRQDINEIGPKLIVQVRSYLEEDQDRRRRERWPCGLPLDIFPILPDGGLGKPQAAAAKNLSHVGIGFHVAAPLEARHVYVAPRDLGPLSKYALLTHITHCTPSAEGGFDVGGMFGHAEAQASS
ncbi:MAG: protein kinase [Gemmataceae bacterium]|nr:protein kinase [Gemmataceae bacterium]